MNRRSFFNKFGVLAAAVSLSPTIFIPKFEAVRWKRRRVSVAVLNPDYMSAKYEVGFLMEDGKSGFFKMFPRTFENIMKTPFPSIPFPPRGNLLNADGSLAEAIPPFILK